MRLRTCLASRRTRIVVLTLVAALSVATFEVATHGHNHVEARTSHHHHHFLFGAHQHGAFDAEGGKQPPATPEEGESDGAAVTVAAGQSFPQPEIAVELLAPRDAEPVPKAPAFALPEPPGPYPAQARGPPLPPQFLVAV